MAATSEPQAQAAGADADSPGDVPAARPASLDRLDVLTGQWEMEATFDGDNSGPGSPAITGRGGRTTFEWLEGRFFLAQRFVSEHPAAPSGIAIIGAGAGAPGAKLWACARRAPVWRKALTGSDLASAAGGRVPHVALMTRACP